jgi:membrane protein
VPSLLKLLPYVVIWLLFTVVYVLLPNTNVRIRSGLLGGILAGTLYQVVQWVYIKFQVGVSTYGAIYGSLAALPLFLIWLQTSWLVVLLGAEISFAEQNVDTYEFEPDFHKVSNHFEQILALRLTQLCVQVFQANERARTAEQFSAFLEIPIRLVRHVLSDLTGAGVLSEVVTEAEKTPAYQPARAIDTLTAAEVIIMLNESGRDTIPAGKSEDWEKLAQRLALFKEKIRDRSTDVLLKDL